METDPAVRDRVRANAARTEAATDRAARGDGLLCWHVRRRNQRYLPDTPYKPCLLLKLDLNLNLLLSVSSFVVCV